VFGKKSESNNYIPALEALSFAKSRRHKSFLFFKNQKYFFNPDFRATKSEKGAHKSGSEINEYDSSFLRSLTWQDITWLKSLTSLPIIVKGILHPDDARIACQYGVKGVMVSNHGGRQLDGVEATIDALKAVVDVVQTLDPHVEVYLDGGVRQGTDVLKALALGAKLVTIGRPVLWGLALDGENGVTLTLKLLRKELELAMALSGCIDVQKVDKDLVKVAGNSKL
jgi:(S)-2-hydroxy-acid oxidase